MEFLTAVSLANKNAHLIGLNHNGMTISEIIVYPTEQEAFRQFNELYYSELNAKKAITPFMSLDVRVGVIMDKEKIRSRSILLHTDLNNIPSELNPVLE